MSKHTEYRMPATMTQVPTVVRRFDNAFASGYMVIIGRESREFSSDEAIEFACSLLQLVKDWSPTMFAERLAEEWLKMANSSSGMEKESDNSSADQKE